jgi:CHAT domain-containing protein/Tfp pilus assembly protein PilF
VLTLFGPDGKEVVTVDSPNGTEGPEPVRAIVGTSGDYRLEVRSPDSTVRPGRYEVRIEELRTASPQDRERTQQDREREIGNRALAEAQHLGARADKQSKEEAIAKYEEAARIWLALGDTPTEAVTLFFTAKAYTSIYNPQKALENYFKTWELLQPLGNSPLLAATLSEVGAVYARSLDDPQMALEYYKKALRVYQTLPDPVKEANLVNQDILFNDIGQAYVNVRKPEQAMEWFKKALPVYEKPGSHPPGEATLRGNIGYTYLLMGKPQNALRYLGQALQLEQNDPSGTAYTFNNMGQAKAFIGEQQKAIGHLREARALKQEALDFYKKARQIFRDCGDRSSESLTLGNIGWVYEELGRKQEALDAYQEGMDKLEGLRVSATNEEIMAHLSDPLAFAYKASLLLVGMGQPDRAFNLTERARARTLLDQLGNARPNHPETTDARLPAEEQELLRNIDALGRRLSAENGKESSALNRELIDSLQAQYDSAQRQYEDYLTRRNLTSPNAPAWRSVATLTLPEVQRLLDKDVTLVSYFFGPDRTLAFVITRDSIHAVEIKVKDSDVIGSIIWIRRSANLSAPRSASLRRLYGWLIAPIRRYITTPTVGIIPHRELNYLPFAALTDGRRYFGEEQTLFYLPSASVLRFINRNKRPLGAGVLTIAQSRAEGLPLLHYADEEAEAVARLYNTQALTTGAASKSEFLRRAGEYSIIHIAAHAELNTVSPLFYSIRLGDSVDDTGRLSVREINNLNLAKASLVVLSACQTDLGAHSQGDDIVALNRAFIYAGTPTVIATLWRVDDESTSDLVKSFYTHLKGGMGKAEALRAAQSDTRRKHPHPYYWAAFVLTGDPGPTSLVKTRRGQ